MRYDRTPILLLLVLLLLTGRSQAQDAAPSEQEVVQQLVQQVKALQEKVTALEAQHTPATSGPEASSPSVAAPAVPAPDKNPELAALSHELDERRGIQWQGFGEVDYKVLNQKIPELGTYGFVPGSAGEFLHRRLRSPAYRPN